MRVPRFRVQRFKQLTVSLDQSLSCYDVAVDRVFSDRRSFVSLDMIAGAPQPRPSRLVGNAPLPTPPPPSPEAGAAAAALEMLMLVVVGDMPLSARRLARA